MGKPHENYPNAMQASTESASPGTQNPGAASEVGYMGNRGKAAMTGGPNYSGGPGTGDKEPSNTPPKA